MAGALEESEYVRSSRRPASRPSTSSPRAIYHVDDAREFLVGQGIDADAIATAGGRQVHECIRAGAQATPGVSEGTGRIITGEIEHPRVCYSLNPLALQPLRDFLATAQSLERSRPPRRA